MTFDPDLLAFGIWHFAFCILHFELNWRRE
jgi:hypothetical protein